jgi:hypothetical protein
MKKKDYYSQLPRPQMTAERERKDRADCKVRTVDFPAWFERRQRERAD